MPWGASEGLRIFRHEGKTTTPNAASLSHLHVHFPQKSGGREHVEQVLLHLYLETTVPHPCAFFLGARVGNDKPQRAERKLTPPAV
jgi:hypothetical protein